MLWREGQGWAAKVREHAGVLAVFTLSHVLFNEKSRSRSTVAATVLVAVVVAAVAAVAAAEVVAVAAASAFAVVAAVAVLYRLFVKSPVNLL